MLLLFLFTFKWYFSIQIRLCLEYNYGATFVLHVARRLNYQEVRIIIAKVVGAKTSKISLQ